ncbi:MAG: rod shape-determining protein MreD [Patescibacteria group bacterium]
MFKKTVFNLILLLLFFFILFGFISHLSIYTNLWIIIIVYLILFFDDYTALLWTFGLGFLLDLFSITPFGFYILVLSLIYLILSHLSKRVLTHKSLSTFITLSLIAIIVFYFTMWNLNIVFGVFGLETFYSFSFFNILIQTLINLLVSVLLFFIANFFTKRLRLESIYND